MSDSRETFQEATNLDIMRALGRLEGKMDGMNDHLGKLNGSVLDLYKKTEKNTLAISGIRIKVAALGAFIGAVASLAGKWIWSRVTGSN